MIKPDIKKDIDDIYRSNTRRYPLRPDHEIFIPPPGKNRDYCFFKSCWTYQPTKPVLLNSHQSSCCITERDLRTAMELNPALVTPDIVPFFFS